jgi:hypothetical protein
MAFGGAPTPPPFDPLDAKALQRSAEQNHRHNVGVTQDLGHILGWVGAVVTWPLRRLRR